ncbi:MAG: hypothetical protein U0838_02030 [Chloroflexota bacterium]
MRTLTLLFYSAATLLLGAVAMPAAVTLIDAYRAAGDGQLLQGVYGYFVVAVAIAAPAAFFVLALASAMRREPAEREGPDPEAVAALLSGLRPDDRLDVRPRK